MWLLPGLRVDRLCEIRRLILLRWLGRWRLPAARRATGLILAVLAGVARLLRVALPVLLRAR
jgi:hypothetical protein